MNEGYSTKENISFLKFLSHEVIFSMRMDKHWGSMMCNTVNLSDCNIRLSNRTKYEFTPQRVKKVKEGSIGKEIRGRETMRERKKRCSVSRGSKKNWSANEGHLRSWMRPIWKWINQQKNKYRKAKKSMKSPDFVNPGIFVYEAMIEEYICIENRKPKFGADSANFLFFLVL